MNQLYIWIKSTFLLISLLSNCLHADTRIEYQKGESTSNETGHTIQIKNNTVRIDAEKQTYILYDSIADTFTVVSERESHYLVIDKNTVNEINETMTSAMREMEANLQNMPAAQQEQMRRMMGSMMAKSLPSQTPSDEIQRRTEPSGRSGTFIGLDCQWHTYYKNDLAKAEYCSSPYSALGISSSDFNAFHRLQLFSMSMASKFGPSDENRMDLDGIPDQQIPLSFKTLNSPSPDESRIKSLSTDTLDNALFMIPEGFKRQQSPSFSR